MLCMRYGSINWLLSPFGFVAWLIMILTVAFLLMSCGKKNSDEPASQSVVRVNGDEITVHQLNNELLHVNVQPSQQGEASKQIASALVDRQILMQAAHKAKLDRNPRVMQAIESAKAKVLAQAYLEEKAALLAKPTDAEISEYRSTHPDIFANRKVFVMDEVVVKTESKNIQDFQALNSTAKTINDVTQWLDAHQINYVRNRTIHAAETVPAELLAKLSKMAAGDLIFINFKGGTVAASMVQIKEAPISEIDSKPFIARILMDQKRKKMAEDEVRRLRSEAEITYINKKFEPNVQQAKPAESANAVKPALAEKIENTKPADADISASHIEKGLSGL